MHPRAEAFQARVAERYDLDIEVLELPAGTRTAQDAADAIGCDRAQIVKSMAMAADDELMLILTSGVNRVDEPALADSVELNERAVRPADPDQIKSILGWSIGGVPPIGHDTEVPTRIDPELLDHETVWAGAGTPKAVFGIDSHRLQELSGATIATCVTRE